MDWQKWQEWTIKGFQALIGIMLLWVGKWTKKNAKPYIANIKTFLKLELRVIKLEKENLELAEQIAKLKYDVCLSENKYLAFLKTTTVPYFMTNKTADLIFANSAFLKMLGFCNLEDALHFGYTQAIPEDEREERRDQRKAYYQNPYPYQGLVNWRNIQTGNLITTSSRCDLIFDENKEFYGILIRLEMVPAK